MDDLAFPYLACLLLGFLGGFTFGFRVAAMVRLGPQGKPAPEADLVEDFA